jgi:hypothetical protein
MKNRIERSDVILKKISSSSLIGPRRHSKLLATPDWLIFPANFHRRHREKGDAHHERISWTFSEHTSLTRHLWRNATSYSADAMKIRG